MGPQEYTLIKMRVLELRGPLAALEGESCLSQVLWRCMSGASSRGCAARWLRWRVSHALVRFCGWA